MKTFLLAFHRLEHGGNHGHSHGLSNTTHKKLTQLTSSTDDNENNSFMNETKTEKPVVKKASAGHGHGHSHGGSGSQMNMRGVYLHVLSDALGSIIVIISALVVWLTEWRYKYYMDPALSVLLVVLMLRSVWPLLRESALILLQTVPTHIEVSAYFDPFVVGRVFIFVSCFSGRRHSAATAGKGGWSAGCA